MIDSRQVISGSLRRGCCDGKEDLAHDRIVINPIYHPETRGWNLHLESHPPVFAL